MAWRWPMRTMMGMRTGRDAGPTRARECLDDQIQTTKDFFVTVRLVF